MTPFGVAIALWVIWALSWLLAAVWSSRAHSSAGRIAQLPYRLITTAGFVLLFGVNPGRASGHFFSLPQWTGWIMTALTAVGFAFAWWARLHLGKLWSAFVTRKDEHRIIDTGPYRIVRHPIYTGIILAAAAIAVLKGNLYAFTGAFLIVAGFWIKARLEERFLSEQLGPETYAAYRRRAPMLIPFFPS
ncbi:MAG: isoprenylcysteine carboxylmethyltransferase family protein [Verrucomicrobia bacterium]|nr:MAG: isoprenylcysteine carboxylmethyltransferase family protein [Verrucomicrobiota bacterium]